MNKGVLFTIDKNLFATPYNNEFIRIYQVGENIMEHGGVIGTHIQKCCEISYVASGEAEFFADGKSTLLSKGDIQIISAGSEHKISACSGSRLRYMFLGFDIISDSGFGKELKAFYSGAKGIIVKDNGVVSSIFNSFVNELSYENEFTADMYCDYARILLVNIYRIYAGILSKSFEANRQQLGGTVFAIMKYIDANIMTVNRISDIAKNLNYSPAYLSRLFKEKVGINIKEYLDERKMDKAKELLTENKYKINEIASMLGYDDYAIFCKRFRKLAGCPPSEYKI